ncbi:related to multidrug resistant protein [Phialocephala subalpina]|uniref:Related to multidrug resistant protein n=1 Tax=Phialocephala subalpina TaxID=576137 RepID=A0A1L7XQF8_9HELO|nr:related to multidrug resistant protein [Phialocephala subalpina]
MPPPSGSVHSPWQSATIIFELKDTDEEQLDVGGSNTDLDEMEKKNTEFLKERDEHFDTNGPSVSISSKQENNGSAPPVEPGSEIIVWWDEPEDRDPENPMNWSSTKKWVNIGTISVISFLVPLVSSMLGPGVELVMEEFNTKSTTFATFAVSIFVLGFASGPLFLAPLSELYGRVIIYNVTNVLFLGFTIMCAMSQNESMLLAARFLSGFAGVATITIGSGTIADIMPREKRGKAVSIWSVGTILGPMVGPIIGGYVAQVAGWRWMFWVISIAVGVVTIFSFVVLRETYPVVLLERKAARLRKQTGYPNYRSKLASDLTPARLFKHSIIRPLKPLICYPIVTVMCIYVAVLYGILYLLFATYSFVFREVYGFSTSATGLVFLAGGIGTLSGLLYVGNFSDRTLKTCAAAGKILTPEDRLPLLITIPGSLTFPVGLFIYGWSVEEHVHWIVPQIGTAITGFGSILIFIGIQTYLIDAFEEYAASVVGANAVLRGTAGALIPLAGLNLYDTLGWGWGNSVLAFIALAFAPMPWIFGLYGAKIRNLSSRVRL